MIIKGCHSVDTSLFASLLLDGLVLVDPSCDALLVRVLKPKVICLQNVEMSKNVSQELVTM